MRSLRPAVDDRSPLDSWVRRRLHRIAAAWALRRTWRLARWIVSRPARLGPTTAAAAALRAWGPEVTAWAALGLLGGLAVVTVASPTGWLLRDAARAWWRSRTVYRWRWQHATVGAGLARRDRHHLTTPTLLRVRTDGEVDRLLVRMLPDGQTVTDWQAQADRLTASWRVLDVRPVAVPHRPNRVELRCLVRDPLRTVVPLPDPPPPGDYSAIPVGRREDGQAATLPLWRPGRGAEHLLIGGATGAGKGSVLWSLLAGLGPGVAAGLVKVWAVDPKGGMELSPGEALYDRFAAGRGADPQAEVVELLELAVDAMRMRTARLARRDLRVLPALTLDDPLVVVLVDELAAVTALVTDTDLARRAGKALRLLLSQGRAPGFAVVAATQDARKETTDARDWFPRRVALRTTEAAQADLILGRGAHDRGARTEVIDPSLPGVGYVMADGDRDPLRVRFAHVDDAQIRALADRWRPAPVILSGVG